MSDSVANEPNTNHANILKEKSLFDHGQMEGPDGTHLPSILIRLRTDTIYRNKLYQTLALSWLSTCLGWNAGQLGPALPDLQVITNTTLDEASYYLTALSLGFLIGALAAGWIFRKGHQMITMSTLTGVFAILTAVIPWCKYYVLMIILFLIRGGARGVIDTGCNIMILEIWGKHNGPYMQAVHFMYAVGGIVSPLATAPFLSIRVHDVNHTSKYTNISNYHNLSENSSASFKSGKIDSQETHNSSVHFAFAITAAFALSCSFIFLYFLCRSTKQTNNNTDHSPNRVTKNLPRSIRLMSLSLMCATFWFYLFFEKAMVFFLPTFTLVHMEWTQLQGSYAATTYWAAFAIGRLSGIIITHRFKTDKVLATYISVLTLSSFGLMITTLYQKDIGVWIFVPMSGFCQSILFPLLLSWIEEDFFKVTGKIVSVIMFLGSIGTMVTPIILGYLIDIFTPMWFPYAEVIASVCMLILYFVLLLIRSKIVFNHQENQTCIPDQINK
ncbi:sodium-dependent glucose transporter 1B-like [Mytilus galloprovincialis]|uniref:sodium-dependent glucose transporter 1B-like n=1 Tax=Mytilus galloprovincialis TaxID=29158 RepID=UPI003F7CC598